MVTLELAIVIKSEYLFGLTTWLTERFEPLGILVQN